MNKVSIVVVGAGSRGWGYADIVYKQLSDHGAVVAVCEPNDEVRKKFAEEFDIPDDRCFRSWEEIVDMPKLADAVCICTTDTMHKGPAVAFANRGYHLLLEKPMAPSLDDCKAIYDAVKKNNVLLAVCHVLRYTWFNCKLKELIDSGLIGNVRTVQLTEQVGYWHQAHSFVRGNCGNEAKCSSMLLQKSCHDMDLLNYLIPAKCSKVSSFGSLTYFNKANQPKGASDRCTTCPVEIESVCPYSAYKIYLRDRKDEYQWWPAAVLTMDHTKEGVMAALKTGPYGRCVFECDNDVVDHQVVNLEFEDKSTASFTMSAFTSGSGREIYIMGDQGALRCQDAGIQHLDFLTNVSKEVAAEPLDESIASGHGGGDYGLLVDFMRAVSENDPSYIASGPDVSLESHSIVFAAEKSRKHGTVESI